MMIKTFELTVQQLSFTVIYFHDITCFHPFTLIFMFSITEFKIIKYIKVLFCLLPPLGAAFQSTDDKSAE
jgi:hypothetical protein